MENKEIWKEVHFTNGDYSVSNIGNVKSNGFYANVAGGGQRFVKPRVLAKLNHNQGYLGVNFGRKIGSKLIHRLVAQAFLDNPSNLGFVNHKDGNKHNNTVSNLEWCTRQHNEDHAFSTGLKNSTGSANTMSKLVEIQVERIKGLKGKLTSRTLANFYNVHPATIQRI